MTFRIGFLRLAALLCCASPVAAQTTRDSSGVRIVDNAKPAWAPGREWRLSARPIVDIGGGAGADSLGRIIAAVRLSDGRIVLGEEAPQLRFYDASGRHVRTVDGKEPGPANLRQFHAITRLAGDSIAVETMQQATIFAPDGAFVRKTSFGPFPPGLLQSRFAAPVGRFDDGTTVVMDFPQGQRGPAGAKRWVDSSSFVLLDGAGAVLRPLGKAPTVVFVAGAQHPSPLVFGPEVVYASSGKKFYLGFSDQYAIRVHDAHWKLERIIRRAWTPRPITRGELDRYVDGWMAMWSKETGAKREAEHREMRESDYPSHLPAYGTILASRAGEIWVREPDLTGAPGCWCVNGVSTLPSRWSVFDPAGRWLGDVTMPPGLVPMEIGTDYVLGRMRDANKAAHAVLFRIDKP